MTIRPAPLELAALASVMRPDWDLPAFQQALDACRFAHTDDDGWDWPRTFRLAAAHLNDPSATPRDLATAARSPFRKDGRAEPSAEWQARKAALLAKLPAPREGQ